MFRKKIVIFCIITINVFSMIQFGKAFGDKKDNFFNPTITKKYDNEYFLADYFFGEIMVYDKDYKLKRIYSGVENLNDLSKIGNELWISLSSKNSIKIINLLDNTSKTFGDKGLRRGEFINPGEIVTDSKYIYIVDEGNNRIQIFDMNKNYVREFTLPKSNKKNAYSLNYSICSVGGKLYCLDKVNKKLYRYKNFQLETITDLKNFIEPYKVYGINNTLYVYEKTKQEFVNIITNKKAKLDMDNEVGIIDIQTFAEAPFGIYFTKNSKLYYYSIIAETSRELKSMMPVAEGFYVKPLDIKIDANKNMYVLDGVINAILVYTSNGKYLKTIKNLPENSYSFDVDANGDFVVLSNKTNSIFRINDSGKVVHKLENSINVMAYEPYYYKKKGKKGIIDNNLYNNKLVIEKSTGYIYITDNQNKKINCLNAKFEKVTTFGKKESVINTFSNKKSTDTFSANDFDKNSITDITINGNIYVLDAPYKRILVFNGSTFVKSFQHEFSSKGLNSISIGSDKIYVVDKDNYKVLIFDKNMKLIKDIDFAKKGYKPIEIIGNYLIATSYVKEFNEKYIIVNINSLF